MSRELVEDFERYLDWRKETLVEARFPHTDHLWLVGDIHIGAKTFDYEKLESHLKYAKKLKAKALLIGDMLENVTTSSKVAKAGAGHEQYLPRDTHPINFQAHHFKRLFQGIDVLGLVIGNHEERLWQQGLDIVEYLCEDLNARNLGVLASVKVGKTSLLLSHGEGAGKNHLQNRMRDWGHHDLLVGGHTHELSVSVVMQGKKQAHLIRSGSYLKDARYAAKKQYSGPRPATGSVMVHLKDGIRTEVLT